MPIEGGKITAKSFVNKIFADPVTSLSCAKIEKSQKQPLTNIEAIVPQNHQTELMATHYSSLHTHWNWRSDIQTNKSCTCIMATTHTGVRIIYSLLLMPYLLVPDAAPVKKYKSASYNHDNSYWLVFELTCEFYNYIF